MNPNDLSFKNFSQHKEAHHGGQHVEEEHANMSRHWDTIELHKHSEQPNSTRVEINHISFRKNLKPAAKTPNIDEKQQGKKQRALSFDHFCRRDKKIHLHHKQNN